MTGNESRAVHQYRRLVSGQEADARLLEQFLRETDATAFAELVRRYGPMVLGVCRRVLRNDTDADDAFQATFLVLARKADSVRNRSSIANWLFGVARFAAVRARDKARRRHDHERRAGRMPQSGTEPDSELLEALDEELERLPDRYRAPLVACFLQGRTQEDAARQMGCSLSTLRRRLEHGQELLRQRLTGRGAVPALVALAGAAGTNAGVSAGVIEATTALAVAFIRGEAGTVPATVLAHGVIAMTVRTKLKSLLAVLVAAGLVGSGLAWQLTAAQPPQSAPADVKMDPPKPEAPKPSDPTKVDPATKNKPAPVEDRIKPGDRLDIRAIDSFEADPLIGVYVVEASGNLPLSKRYGGRIKVDGLTLEEAEQLIENTVRQYVKRCQVQLARASLDPAALETRVQQLEKEVKELRAVVDELRGQKPGGPRR